VGLIKQDLVSMSQTFAQTQAHMNDRLDKAAQVFGSLQNELGKMQELGRSMKDIQDVLKSPKLRGNIGEQMMTDILKQQLPKANYSLQYAFRSGEKVDAVIKSRNGLIPIDSKFPAENFIKLRNTEDETEKAKFRKEFIADVKRHIQAISRKYILPSEGTIDYALMYIPGEAVFYDIINDSELFEFGAKHRVLLVSPQSFYFYLGTVLRSLEGELIEQKAKEVMNNLKGILMDSHKFGIEMTLVNKHLTNAKNVADQAVMTYVKLHGKIESANQLTGQKVEEIEAVTEKTKHAALIGEEE
ncbi:MAG TPA: DNA recombination protein RmuC, partial [Candidatus Nanoarchaeia archaeon]|nr:DNA recombination protein RmuC [Candidatus Nanoarchaeia archaeon]